jgi:Ca-activated chloride channel family protein
MNRDDLMRTERSRELLAVVSKKLGIPAEQLEAELKAGKFDSAIAGMQPAEAQKFRQAMQNPELVNKLMSTPQAQALYKSNKDAGRGVYAVFVADVSGSMDGDPISAMKESLLNSMQYITKGNQIGLVSYADSVTIDLPIAEWDLNQMSYFKGAVESLRAGGNTATYDALVVAIDMLEKATADDPEARKMVFLLSDGEQNQGYSLRDITDIVKGLRIPIYTIGYNANIDALKQVSSINEAASIDASTEDVVYQLKTLFNANM